MRILVVGITGMLGNAVYRYFHASTSHKVFGTARSGQARTKFSPALQHGIIEGVDVGDFDSLASALAQSRPDVVVNAVGLVKQLRASDDPLNALPLNALFPHRLARLCAVARARLVHVSTDCVFTGAKGHYIESDAPDAVDLYGRSKLLGEVDYPHAITLRTSIIGHQLDGQTSLVGWFLAQEGSVRGYRRAVFSGLPTVELAKVMADHVIPNPHLHGLYHVAVEPINKCDLLTLVAATYGKDIEIVPDDGLVIDRSLDASRFNQATGYAPPAWPKLVEEMKAFG